MREWKVALDVAGVSQRRPPRGRAVLIPHALVLCLALVLSLGLASSAHAVVQTTRASIAYLVAHTVGGFESFTPPATPTYTDVPTYHACYAEIEYAWDRGIIAGYGDGSFHPEWVATRDQGAVYVARTIAAREGGFGTYVPPVIPTFSDVPVDHWAYAHIEFIVDYGVTSGYGDGTFRPIDLWDLFDAVAWFFNATGTYVDPNTIPPGPGAIAGLIRDATNSLPIVGASIVACGPDYYEATTGGSGDYVIPSADIGSGYSVCAWAPGYAAASTSNVSVAPGETSTVNLYLAPGMPEPPPLPLIDSYTMYCPDWYIKFNSAGYSHRMVKQYPHHTVHENLVGEWAAGVRYTENSTGGGPSWLSPYLASIGVYTDSDFWTSASFHAWDDPANPTVGHDAGYSEIRNAHLKIAISYTMYRLDTGSAAGLRPGGVGWRDPSITNRYVLGQTYQITNRSAEPVTNLVFYQLLHSHPNDDPGPANFGLYDPTPYGTGGLPDFHYDITQYGSSLWNPPGTDITGFSAQDEPTAWGIGELPGHYGPPPYGLFWDIYSGSLPMTVEDGPAEIAGIMEWDIGTLDPGATVTKKVTVWNGYYSPELPPVGRVLSIPSEQRGVPGTVVEVPINIGDASDVAGVQVTVDFDSSRLEAPDGAKGNVIAADEHWQLAEPVVTPTTIELLAYHDMATGLPEGSGSDSLLVLSFDVKPGAPVGSTAHLSFDTAVLSDPFGDPIPYATVNGSISIADFKPDYIEIYAIESPQVGDSVHPMPFALSVEACDLMGVPLLGYATSLNMYDATGTLAPVVAGIVDGVWTGDVTIGMPTSTDAIGAYDASFPEIWTASNDFQVVGLGDTNADDVVNILDVVKVLNFALGRLTPSPGWQAWVADINQDAGINVLDVLLAVNLSLGQPLYTASFTPLAALSPDKPDKVKPVRVSLDAKGPKTGPLAADIVLDNAAGIAGIQASVEYDADAMTLASVALGDLPQAAGGWTVSYQTEGGVVRIVAYNTRLQPLEEGSGSVVTLTFEPSSDKGKGPRPSLAEAILGSPQGAPIASTVR